jgi:hypothetical protein
MTDHAEEVEIPKHDLLVGGVLGMRALRRRLAGLRQVLDIAEMRDLVGDLEGRHDEAPNCRIDEGDHEAHAAGARYPPHRACGSIQSPGQPPQTPRGRAVTIAYR